MSLPVHVQRAGHRNSLSYATVCPSRSTQLCRSRRTINISRTSISSSSGRAQTPSTADEADVVGGMLDLCLATTARVTEAAVSRLSDVLQSIAPPDATRHKIEVSVKAALILLILGLLKGVISFVLLVGCVGLAAYTATQVFGWNGLSLSNNTRGGAGSDWRTSTWEQQQQQQRCYSEGGPSPPNSGQDPAWRQRQQQQQSRPRGQRMRQQGTTDDVVDVFHYSSPAAS